MQGFRRNGKRFKHHDCQRPFFMVATARSASSAAPLLEKLNLRLPVILMNGVVIYDMEKREPVSVCPIEPEAARAAFGYF